MFQVIVCICAIMKVMRSKTPIVTSNKVLEIREVLGLTQQQMADEMGVHHGSERRYEYTGTVPKSAAVMKNLKRLAKKANVPLD